MQFSIYNYGDDYYDQSIFCVIREVYSRVALKCIKSRQPDELSYKYKVTVEEIYYSADEGMLNISSDHQVFTPLKVRCI